MLWSSCWSITWLANQHPSSWIIIDLCSFLGNSLFFFFFFLSLLNHFWGPFGILFLTSTAKWKTPADSSLKSQILNAFTSKKKKVCACLQITKGWHLGEVEKARKESSVYLFLPVKILWKVKSWPSCMCEYLLHMN